MDFAGFVKIIGIHSKFPGYLIVQILTSLNASIRALLKLWIRSAESPKLTCERAAIDKPRRLMKIFSAGYSIKGASWNLRD